MRIIFWNIGSELTDVKIETIDLLKNLNSEIICIAEGTNSIDNCKKLEEKLILMNYEIYYSPTFSSNAVYNLSFGFNPFGLKVFIKKGILLESKFSLTQQKLDGRIVCLDIENNQEKYCLFFIHSTSKLNPDIKQTAFFVELTMLIRIKLLDKQEHKVIIIGDFNAQPWEENIRMSQYINSFFHKKEFLYFLGKGRKERIYFNPFFEYILNNSNRNLLGTYYDSTFTSLIDFALFSKEISTYDINIIDSFESLELMKETQKKHLLVNGFDHLPIQINLI